MGYRYKSSLLDVTYELRSYMEDFGHYDNFNFENNFFQFCLKDDYLNFLLQNNIKGNDVIVPVKFYEDFDMEYIFPLY